MKKIFILAAAIFVLSFNSIFAAKFIMGFTGRLGASSASSDGRIRSDFRDFDSSFSLQPGIIWGHDDFLSSMLLFDIGYDKDRYEFKYNIKGNRVVENFKFNSLYFGLFPRLNIGFVSIGIGGGIKLPLSMSYKLRGTKNDNKYYLDFGDIKDTFDACYIPYVRTSVDFLLKTKEKFMMTFGAC